MEIRKGYKVKNYLKQIIMARKFTITAMGDEKTKTFDIVKLWNDGTATTYRTGELSEGEFEELDYNTESDWENFLRTDQSYYVVK